MAPGEKAGCVGRSLFSRKIAVVAGWARSRSPGTRAFPPSRVRGRAPVPAPPAWSAPRAESGAAPADRPAVPTGSTTGPWNGPSPRSRQGSPRERFQPDVVPRCDSVTAQHASPPEEVPELRVGIAAHAWIRGAALPVFLDEVVDHVAGEFPARHRRRSGRSRACRLPGGASRMPSSPQQVFLSAWASSSL